MSVREEKLAHFLALRQLITKYGSDLSVDDLYIELNSLEKTAHNYALEFCNGLIDTDKYNYWKDIVTKSVEDCFYSPVPGFFVNSDPRGYALKIDEKDNKALQAEGIHLHKDWGGYGILAPNFNTSSED